MATSTLTMEIKAEKIDKFIRNTQANKDLLFIIIMFVT